MGVSRSPSRRPPPRRWSKTSRASSHSGPTGAGWLSSPPKKASRRSDRRTRRGKPRSRPTYRRIRWCRPFSRGFRGPRSWMCVRALRPCRRACRQVTRTRWSFPLTTLALLSATKLRRADDPEILEATVGRALQERWAMADFLGLMKQATELKAKMEAMQAELDQIEVEGTSGGGLVTDKLSAKGDMKGVTIDDTLMKPSESEIVADLIVAAHADARRKAETLLQEKMKNVAGGLPLPPGMKLF